MPGVNVEVTLSEVLEVRGAPLREVEIWAVLCQATESLQDELFQGSTASDDGPRYALTPATLLLCVNGRVSFEESMYHPGVPANYIPPEHSKYSHAITEAELEKMYVFGLGMTMYTAADYKLDKSEDLHISSSLDALLSAMCEEHPSTRSSLAHILEACTQYARRMPRRLPHSHHIMNLYKLVLGSDTQLDAWFRHENDRHIRAFRHKQRKSPPSSQNGSRSRSRSRRRSRSRSRSRSIGRGQNPRGDWYQERPLTMGHSHTDLHDGRHSRTHRSRYKDRHRLDSRGYGSQPNLYNGWGSQDGLNRNPPRKVLGQIQDHPPQMGQPPPLHAFHVTAPLLGQGAFQQPPPKGLDSLDLSPSSLQDPVVHQHLQDTYVRLKDRQVRLRALRHGLDMDEQEASELASLPSDMVDHKSLSANSYTHGAFHPGLMSPYGSQVALQLGHSSAGTADISDDEVPVEWLQRQEAEVQQRQREIEKQRKGAGSHSRASSRERPLSPPMSELGAPKAVNRRTRPQGKPPAPPTGQTRSRTPYKVREFVGPEFVHMSKKPAIFLTIPQAKIMNPNKLHSILVILLSGQRLTIMAHPSNTVRQLFDTIISHLALPEHFFFGITTEEDGEHFFMDNDKSLQKAGPSGWASGKGQVSNVTFKVFFRVKFYVENINTLKHPMTRHLLYLQLRRDLLEDRIHMVPDQAMSLAAIAIQAEYGDQTEEDEARNYFEPDQYLATRILRRMGMTYARDNLPTMHQDRAGWDMEQAETEFIKDVQQLSEYGLHFYKIFKSKKETHQPLWAGISIHGILVAEQNGETRNVMHRHTWTLTQKISYNRRRFSILPKQGSYKVAKLNYYAGSMRRGRYLVQLCTHHHSFQMKMKKRADIKDMIEEEHPREAGSGSAGRGIAWSEEEDDDGDEDLEDGMPLDDSFDDLTDAEGEQQLYQSFDHLPNYENAQEQIRPKSSLNTTYPVNNDLETVPRSLSALRKSPQERGNDVMAILDSLPLPPEELPLTAPEPFIMSPELAAAPDRRIVVVELVKEPSCGIGLVIVGGENLGRLDLGIFVKAVDPDGPAARSGSILPGDRIVAINGQSMEGVPHHVAVEMIRDSAPVVQLVVTQTKSPLRASPAEDTDSLMSLDAASVEAMIARGHVQTSTPGHRHPSSGRSTPGQMMRTVEGGDDLNLSLGHARSTNKAGSSRTHSPADSSDLDLENVLPPEALSIDYIQGHMSKVATRANEDHAAGDADSESELDEALTHGRRSLVKADISPEARSQVHTPTAPLESIRHGDTYEVVLHKKDGSLGLNVTGGVNTSVKQGGIHVKSLHGGGAAELEGRIRVGDRVLEVNGISLAGVTHKQAVETLRNAPQVSMLVMVRGQPPSSNDGAVSPPEEIQLSTETSPISHDHQVSHMEVDYPFVTKVNTFKVALIRDDGLASGRKDGENSKSVNLTKDSSGLGFSVQGGHKWHSDPDLCVVCVRKIYPHTPAANSTLQVGDVLLKVNGQKLKDKSNNEILDLLRTAPREVHLEICRPHGVKLPLVSQMSVDSSSISDDTVHSRPGQPSVSRPPAEGYKPGSPHHKPTTSDHDDGNVSPSTQPRSSASEFEGSDSERNDSPVAFSYKPGIPTRNGVRPVTPGGNESDSNNTSITGEYTVNKVPSRQHSGSSHTSSRQKVPPARQMSAPEQQRSPSPHRSGHYQRRASSPPRHVHSRSSSPPGHPRLHHQHTLPPTPVNSDRERHTSSDDTVVSPGTMDELEQRNRAHAAASRLDDLVAYNSLDQSDSDFGEEEFEVTMMKGDKGLGFTVAGGQHTTGFFFVKDILYEPAISNPAISKGDRIIKVNEMDMTGLNHREAIEYLRQTPRIVTLRLRRASPQGSDDMYPPEKRVTFASKIATTKEVKRLSVIERQFEEAMAASYTPSSETDSADTRQTSRSPVRQYSQDLNTSQERSASRSSDGQMSNASSLSDVSIPIAGDDRRASSGSFGDEGIVYKVELQKPLTGSLGISVIQGEKGTSSSLFVHSITPGSVAEQCGRIRDGDRLLQVDGQSVIGMAHSKAVALIKNSQGRVALTLSRSISRTSSVESGRESPFPRRRSLDVLEEYPDSEGDGSGPNNVAHHNSQNDRSHSYRTGSPDKEDNPDAFDSLTDEEGLQAFVRRNTITSNAGGDDGANRSGGEDSWGDHSPVTPARATVKPSKPEKPPRRNLPPRLPPDVNDAWLKTLVLVKPPEETTYYRGRQLQSLIKQLRSKVIHGEAAEEYKMLRRAKLTDNCNNARDPGNKTKNRYRNVLPYDANRVTLAGSDDYINASHIYVTVGEAQRHYIAAQGPLQQTTGDFWRMIWEQRVQVIAMVTQDVENDKVKCHRYWPDSAATPFTVFNRYEVSLARVQRLEHFDVHHIAMEDLETGRVHRLLHLNFTSWPEQGTTESGIPLLQYMRFLHLVHDSGPIVVHCSAGIGRTGAFITIDVAVSLIENDLQCDIQKIVTDLRRQRQGMIQTKDQYVFCYKTCLEALESIQQREP